MLPRAVTERVAYVPGTAFYADGQGRQHACGSRTATRRPERIREGVRRLAAVVDAELELLDDVRPGGRPRRPRGHGVARRARLA